MSGTMRRVRPVLVAALVVSLGACGGDASPEADDAAATGTAEVGAGGTDDDAATGEPGGGGGGGDASATLTVDGDVHRWTSADMTTCEVDGLFPASADFGVPPSQGGEGPWVQFIDRGDGGVNFSAVIDGVQYMGTGSGEAEIGADGFTYRGSMGREGESVDVELEVTC